MANKTLFKSLIGKLTPATDALNEERAPAYALSPKQQLAQYAATGCAAYIANWNEELQVELRLSEGAAAELARQTEGFSFAYLKELFLSSMMQWMTGRGVSMDKIILAEATQLRAQMAAPAKAPALNQ